MNTDAVHGLSDKEFDAAIRKDNATLQALKEAGMVPGKRVTIETYTGEQKEVEIISINTRFYRVGKTRRYKVMVTYKFVAENGKLRGSKYERSAKDFLEKGTLKA